MLTLRCVGYPPLPDDHDGFSCDTHEHADRLNLEDTGPTDETMSLFFIMMQILQDQCSCASVAMS